jgi:PEP-CTERM motif
MFSAIRNTALGAAALGLSVGLALPVQAAYVVTLQQVGANVVATGSGAIDLTDLTLFNPSTTTATAGVVPNRGLIVTGQISALVNLYDGYAGPTTIGSGGVIVASSGSGQQVGIQGLPDGFSAPVLTVPVGYLSDASLSDTSTYNNRTFASLGVTPGTYVWTWGTGAHADSFTLETVPEPASLGMLALGLAGLGLARRMRRV